MFFVRNKAKGIVDEGMEALESGVKTQAQQTVKSVTGQFSSQVSKGGDVHGGENHTTDDLTAEVVGDFYAPSDPQTLIEHAGKRLPKAGEMSMDEEKKFRSLRMELHKQNYLNDLLERKSQAQEHQEKEQVAEEEKKMEELQVEDKKKKDDDVALKMATNKTEQFPGVAG